MTHQPSERTFTAEEFRKASSAVWLATDKDVAVELEAMLLQAAAAHEREAALRERNESLERQFRDMTEAVADSVLREVVDSQRAALAEAQREIARLTGELAIWQVKVDGLREVMRDSLACDAHSVYLSTWREVERHMDALGLTAQPPQDAEPAT